MTDDITSAKKVDFSLLLKDKPLLIATATYILLAAVFLFRAYHYICMLTTFEEMNLHLSECYTLIEVAALIFPLLLVIRKKIKSAVLIALGGLALSASAFFLTVTPATMFWISTMILPFVLLIPYIWYITGTIIIKKQ